MGDHRDGRTFLDRRLRILTPLRHPDFRKLWIGMTASLLGDGIFYVALAWQAYEISNTPSALSTIGVAMTVPHVVFLLAGGVVSDRFDRRKVMIAADLMRALAVGTMGALALSGRLELWHMLVLSGLFGAGTAFFGPAFDAIVPGLVPDDELNQANSLDQLVRPAALRMLGPALGGLIVAIDGPGTAFVVDACTFLFSISCVALMRARHTTPDQPHGSAIDDIREGFAFVRSQVWLWGTFLAATLGYLIFWGPSEVLLPFVVRNDLHGSAADLGLIFAVGGIGAMTSAIVMGNRQMPRRQHDLHLRRVDDLHARDRRLRSGAVPLAGHGRLLRVQCPRGRGDDRLGDDQGTTGARPAARPGLELRLVHLDRAGAGLLRVHRPDRRGAWAPSRPSSAPVCWAASSPWRSCSCRGCATSSGAASSQVRRSNRPRTRVSGPSRGRSRPSPLVRGPFPLRELPNRL